MHHLDEVRNRHRGKEVVTGNFFSFARIHVLHSHRGDTRAGIGLLLSACRFPLAPSFERPGFDAPRVSAAERRRPAMSPSLVSIYRETA
ncbi:MAG: hypothetical protein UU37_C0005G0002 [Candidatus Gottesmanbacteria bacterium GW2011_GWA2_41_12]|uniref:Uncharacterized protein n=1 Tax=Candidatus Gottesmanbacteria bacterium GW2011_GWA2_41_12 TaxID=1618440 RepID=A0A0G0ULF8_9BACT|nr:MAG: hypothetical protein UU37_C0005G0002 [Candidatus Gottesmanbacteria bacterium GW2011_GWA2_41_12]